jgi:hypothetical protein
MAYTTIDKSTDYFNTVLYTGTGSSQAITGVGHAPNFVWIKCRDVAKDNMMFDSVRGVQKSIRSNSDNAQDTGSDFLSSFDSDGFTAGGNGKTNGSGSTYVSWNWKAGGTASTNTDGSITSSVSANPTAGFSIVSYTGNATNGATVGHGLGAVPHMLIGKDLSDGSGWGVWHRGLASNRHRLTLSTNGATSQDDALYGGSGNTAPTSTVFSLGSGGGLNGSNANIVYAFTSIKGFSKFGTWKGRNSQSANDKYPFIYTGFKVGFLMVKGLGSNQEWPIFDTAREPSNDGTLKSVWANLNNTESSGYALDLYSNGFKVFNTGGTFNTDGTTYTYMAFAENPFVTSSGVPTVAR